MTDASTQLRTVRQMAEELKPTGAFSEATLRWLIFNAKSNGFDGCLVRVGRRVFIDRQHFNVWVNSQREAV